MTEILLVEDLAIIRENLKDDLQDDGYAVTAAGSIQEAFQAISDSLPSGFDLLITDMVLPLRPGEKVDPNKPDPEQKQGGLKVIQRIKEKTPWTNVIAMTGYLREIQDAVNAMRAGAWDYMIKPVEPDDLLQRVRLVFERQESMDERGLLLSKALDAQPFMGMVGKSKVMNRLSKKIERIAQNAPHPYDSVLIRGETGTGKELAARAIHDASPCAHGPFIARSVANIPQGMVSSELFGHRKGAFTGAERDRAGAFKAANGGTIFLDEIGDMPPSEQTALLRVMESQEIMPLGTDDIEKIDVRVIAATDKDVKQWAQERDGRFSQGLYRRFSFELEVPPLRERKEDIPLLAEHFLRQMAEQRGREQTYSLRSDAISILQSYYWPWNVGELRNVMTRITTLANRTEIDEQLLREIYPDLVEPSPMIKGEPQTWEDLQQIEHRLILNALERNKGNVTKAAAYLGVTRSKLYRLKVEHGITE